MAVYLSVQGLDKLIARFQAADTAMRRAIQSGLMDYATGTAEQLSQAAPKGQRGGSSPPPGGDDPGTLAESFSAVSVAAGRVQVRTGQPTKLSYITHGTGLYGPRGQKITPRVKKALMWETAEHPYRSVRGIHPNPFVEPVLATARAEVSAKMQETVRAALSALGL